MKSLVVNLNLRHDTYGYAAAFSDFPSLASSLENLATSNSPPTPCQLSSIALSVQQMQKMDAAAAENQCERRLTKAVPLCPQELALQGRTARKKNIRDK